MPVECKQVRKGKNVKNKATESVDNKQESMRFFCSIRVILSSVQYLSYSSLLLMSLDPVGIVCISS